jgi:DNA mismatch repair ATPase MutS
MAMSLYIYACAYIHIHMYSCIGLLQDFSSDARILPMHMRCRVDDASKQLVMLYKLQRGVCPQSYGMECGLRAGLPPHIIERARVKSQEFEAAQHVEDAAPRLRPSGVNQESVGKRPRSQASEDPGSVCKLRRILELVPSDRALQGMDAVRVFSQLSELRDTFG